MWQDSVTEESEAIRKIFDVEARDWTEAFEKVKDVGYAGTVFVDNGNESIVGVRDWCVKIQLCFYVWVREFTGCAVDEIKYDFVCAK